LKFSLGLGRPAAAVAFLSTLLVRSRYLFFPLLAFTRFYLLAGAVIHQGIEERRLELAPEN
jgi:hypothetical protein